MSDLEVQLLNVFNCNSVVSRTIALAEYLISHPDVLVHDPEKNTYFAFSTTYKRFYYHKPSNSVRKGIYEARGLYYAARTHGLLSDSKT